MLAAEHIHMGLAGAWRLMNGKADGLRQLDLSADGFWNSFFAMVVAGPALLVNWVAIASRLGPYAETFGGRLSVLARLVIIDSSMWILPLLAFALIAPRAGLSDRFVAYVVASNWASALVAWLMLPSAMMWLFLPQSVELADFFMLLLFGVSIVLFWRMTNVVIGRGAAIGTAVFMGMLFVTLVVQVTLQWVLGL